jgi:hypothetical protein
MFSQQVRINLIGFGARWARLSIHRLGVDGIDRVACGQQSGNQQAMRRFDDTSQLRFPLGSADGERDASVSSASPAGVCITRRAPT